MGARGLARWLVGTLVGTLVSWRVGWVRAIPFVLRDPHRYDPMGAWVFQGMPVACMLAWLAVVSRFSWAERGRRERCRDWLASHSTPRIHLLVPISLLTRARFFCCCMYWALHAPCLCACCPHCLHRPPFSSSSIRAMPSWYPSRPARAASSGSATLPATRR